MNDISPRRKHITNSLSHLGLMAMGAWAGLFSAGVLKTMPELAVDSIYAFLIAALLLIFLLIYNKKYLKEIFHIKRSKEE